MPTVWIQQGTVFNPIPPLARAKRRIAKLYYNSGKDLFILSGNDSDHDMASMHYNDSAFDFAINDVPKNLVELAAEDIGPEELLDRGITSYFDIVEYKSRGFYHIEYDPK